MSLTLYSSSVIENDPAHIQYSFIPNEKIIIDYQDSPEALMIKEKYKAVHLPLLVKTVGDSTVCYHKDDVYEYEGLTPEESTRHMAFTRK
jgi:hypothetical protein